MKRIASSTASVISSPEKVGFAHEIARQCESFLLGVHLQMFIHRIRDIM